MEGNSKGIMEHHHWWPICLRFQYWKAIISAENVPAIGYRLQSLPTFNSPTKSSCIITAVARPPTTTITVVGMLNQFYAGRWRLNCNNSSVSRRMTCTARHATVRPQCQLFSGPNRISFWVGALALLRSSVGFTIRGSVLLRPQSWSKPAGRVIN